MIRQCSLTVIFAAAVLFGASPQSRLPQEWPWYGGDAGGNRYSTLNDINRENVKNLKLVWEWKPGEEPIAEKGIRPENFEGTPLMIDGILYLSTSYNRVVPLDAETGRPIWVYDPKAYQEEGHALNGVGYVHRGVAAWRDNGKPRLFMVSHYKRTDRERSTRCAASSGCGGIAHGYPDARTNEGDTHCRFETSLPARFVNRPKLARDVRRKRAQA
jgi:hypothetical protein